MLTSIKWSNTFSKSSILPLWKGYTPFSHYWGIRHATCHFKSTPRDWNSYRKSPFGFPQCFDWFVVWASDFKNLTKHPICLDHPDLSNSNVGEMENRSEKKSITRKMRRSVQRRGKTQKRTVACFESVQFMRFLQRWMLITVSFRYNVQVYEWRKIRFNNLARCTEYVEWFVKS